RENVPKASTPLCAAVPLRHGAAVGPMAGYSHIRMDPFVPAAPQWMRDIMTLSMFDAISRKSTVLPSALARKIASPCARESAGVEVVQVGHTSSSPVMWLPRFK